jgi:hypothetical protein
MQVFGLPGHIVRNARGALRFLAAQTADIEAARRRDALAQGHGARADQRAGGQGGGLPRSTLYRWLKARRAVEPAAAPPAPAQAPEGLTDLRWIIRCEPRKSSARSYANRASPHPTPPSGASSAGSSVAERFSPLGRVPTSTLSAGLKCSSMTPSRRGRQSSRESHLIRRSGHGQCACGRFLPAVPLFGRFDDPIAIVRRIGWTACLRSRRPR